MIVKHQQAPCCHTLSHQQAPCCYPLSSLPRAIIALLSMCILLLTHQWAHNGIIALLPYCIRASVVLVAHWHISRIPLSSWCHYCVACIRVYSVSDTLVGSKWPCCYAIHVCPLLQTQSTFPNFPPAGRGLLKNPSNFSEWLRKSCRMADDGGGESSSEMAG